MLEQTQTLFQLLKTASPVSPSNIHKSIQRDLQEESGTQKPLWDDTGRWEDPSEACVTVSIQFPI